MTRVMISLLLTLTLPLTAAAGDVDVAAPRLDWKQLAAVSAIERSADATPDDVLFRNLGWRIHPTDHFRVIYGQNPARAATHAELLERTYHRFYEAFADFDVTPVDEPMVCLFFENKDDYLKYAQRIDRVDMSWTVAYYSARTNRTAFYRYSQPGEEARVRITPASRETGEDQLYGSADRDGGLGSYHAHPVSLASATHEAAHQLAFNSGLQRRGVLYPLWVSEGLATNFELATIGGAFGPEHDNVGRRQRLQRLYRSGGIDPLREFLTVTHPPTTDAHATDLLYAQGWGLFQFLYQQHRDALVRYLEDLRDQPRGERHEATLQLEFVRRFGPIDDLETQWHAWIDGR